MAWVDGSVLVTGASRGLGAEIAVALAGTGRSVAVNYGTNEQAAASVVSRIVAAGGRAQAFRADVTDPVEVGALVEDVTARLGPPTTLVLNATGPQPTTPVDGLAWEDVAPMVDFFLKSPVLLTTAVVAGMRALGGGRIVHVGSDVVEQIPAGSAAYVAAKFAQLGFARSSALELGPSDITVNTVSPGWVPVERHADVEPAELDAYAGGVPLGRLGTPADVAAAVRYLASEDASFVTGTVVRVNGGSTIGRE